MMIFLFIMDPHKNKQLVVLWTDIIRSDPKTENLFGFSSSFLLVVYSIINGSLTPCLLPKAQSLLQLRKDAKV